MLFSSHFILPNSCCENACMPILLKLKSIVDGMLVCSFHEIDNIIVFGRKLTPLSILRKF